jgi:hypothetical protein
MGAAIEQRHRYGCAFPYEVQVFGRRRHRAYLEFSGAAFTDPLLSGACPECPRPLPGNDV